MSDPRRRVLVWARVIATGALEVLLVFLKLGLTSFGGPVAHLGYFRHEFVVKRRWLTEEAYADLVGLCQFLPGPASSQVGFSIGLLRAGLPGGLAAWAGFTLPSAMALVLFAYGATQLDGSMGMALLHGLKLVAVAIVAHAVLSMARILCPDWQRALIAVGAASMLLLFHSPLAQLGVVALGGVLGLALLRRTPGLAIAGDIPLLMSRRTGFIALALFFLLLAGLPVWRALEASNGVAVFEAYYRSGALVFGGGHVVLPWLRESFVTPGWLSDDVFLAGYGAAQAVPGPLFSFAAYLGTLGPAPGGLAGAAIGLIAIFLPGVLILLGTLPFWATFRELAGARAALAGINAAVVGLLAAALYDPVWTSAVKSVGDIVLAIAGFVLLAVWRAPPFVVVVLTVLGSMAMAALELQGLPVWN